MFWRVLLTPVSALLLMVLGGGYAVYNFILALLLPISKIVPRGHVWHVWLSTRFMNYSSTALVLYTQYWAGFTCRAYGTPLPPFGSKEKGMLWFNHLSFVDPLMFGLWLFQNEGVDYAAFKGISAPFVKWTPHGLLLWFCGDIFVGRKYSTARNERSMLEGIEEICGRDVPAQFLFFAPEGSIQTKNLFEKSISWAREQGIDSYRHLLVPKLTGMRVSVQAMKRLLPSTPLSSYDITIGYPDAGPGGKGPYKLPDMVTPRARTVHVHCRRLPPIKDYSDKGIADWLYARFKEKDDLLENFYKTGAFPDPRPPSTAAFVSYYFAMYLLTYVAPVTYLLSCLF